MSPTHSAYAIAQLLRTTSRTPKVYLIRPLVVLVVIIAACITPVALHHLGALP